MLPDGLQLLSGDRFQVDRHWLLMGSIGWTRLIPCYVRVASVGGDGLACARLWEIGDGKVRLCVCALLLAVEWMSDIMVTMRKVAGKFLVFSLYLLAVFSFWRYLRVLSINEQTETG